jgi:hypothetical protein
VVPNIFELFCLWFILVEDCVAILNVPLHTGGERGIKKTSSVTQNLQKTVLKNEQLKQRGKKEAYIEPRRDKHPVPERIKLVHNVIMSHAMHQEIDQAKLSQLVIWETVNKLLSSKFSKNAKLQ